MTLPAPADGGVCAGMARTLLAEAQRPEAPGSPSAYASSAAD
ncbi:hypothetical protein [Lacticaseibacillus daqingensis]|nr:hypothetical protein [Lacticaseibacillus daqingensis]